MSLIQVINSFGIPLKDEEIDLERLKNEAKLTLISNKAIRGVL